MAGMSFDLIDGVSTGKLKNFLHFYSWKSEVRIYTRGLKGNFLYGYSVFGSFYWVFFLSSFAKEVFDFSVNCFRPDMVSYFYGFLSDAAILSAIGVLRSAITQLSRVAGVAMMRKSDYLAVFSLSKWHCIPKF